MANTKKQTPTTNFELMLTSEERALLFTLVTQADNTKAMSADYNLLFQVGYKQIPPELETLKAKIIQLYERKSQYER